MSKRGADFARKWAAENIGAEPYRPQSDLIKATALELTVAALQADVTDEEIEEDIGDLQAFVACEYDRRIDEEGRNPATKND